MFKTASVKLVLSKQKFSEKYKHKNMKYLTLKYTFLFSKQTEVSFEDQKKFVQFITSSRLAGLVKISALEAALHTALRHTSLC